MAKSCVRLVVLPLVVMVAGCEATKSANPLSPDVAGPIPGVAISAPVAVDPSAGAQVDTTRQPLTLVVSNASTNGVRPLSYLFEVATDAGFTNKIFSRDGIAQGAGRTSLRLSDALSPERTYYWRARAQDGANTGPFSPSINFDVFTPVVIQAPTAISPVNNELSATNQPVFVIGNALRTGPAGAITYWIEVADSDTFARKLGVWAVPEEPGQTRLGAPEQLPAGQYFWHVRATDAKNTSPYSPTQAFRTPATAPPPSGGVVTPIGDWQQCSALASDPPALVTCVHGTIRPASTEAAFEVTKRVAWLLRGQGAGLMIKNGGENVVSWQGYSFSAARIEYADCHYVKILSDVGPGGANTPTWVEQGQADCGQYVPAIDPNKP